MKTTWTEATPEPQLLVPPWCPAKHTSVIWITGQIKIGSRQQIFPSSLLHIVDKSSLYSSLELHSKRVLLARHWTAFLLFRSLSYVGTFFSSVPTLSFIVLRACFSLSLLDCIVSSYYLYFLYLCYQLCFFEHVFISFAVIITELSCLDDLSDVDIPRTGRGDASDTWINPAFEVDFCWVQEGKRN